MFDNKLRYEKIEMSCGPYGEVPPEQTVSFAEAKALLEQAVEKAKANYLVLDADLKGYYPYISAEICAYALNPHPTSPYDKVIWFNLQWLRQNGEVYSRCKEKLRIKTHTASRFRLNKPDIFWDIVQDFFKEGKL